MAAHALVHWYVHLHLWLWIQTQIDWVFQKFDEHLHIVRLLHWIHIHQTVVLIYPDLYLTLVGLVWCHGILFIDSLWAFIAGKSAVNLITQCPLTYEFQSGQNCVTEIKDMLCAKYIKTLCYAEMQKVTFKTRKHCAQNAETLCSKRRNTMLKMQKHYFATYPLIVSQRSSMVAS